MRLRWAAGLACLILTTTIAGPAVGAPQLAPLPKGDETISIDGVGAAHGFGMAMDGVEGEARAGWSHDRILDLFYPGTRTGQASGEVRVWLAEGGEEELVLPSGGTVFDHAPPPGSAPGFSVAVGPGGSVWVRASASGIEVSTLAPNAPPGEPAADRASAAPGGGSDGPALRGAGATPGPAATPLPSAPLGTPRPRATLLPRPVRTPRPTPHPTSKPSTAPTPPSQPAAFSTVWIVPRGNPAVTEVAATGHAYRGSIEVRRVDARNVRLINHVDLETYVDGIAEEKGAGWPPEAMRALAVAARTLAAATMSWYGSHHADGYDICPSDACQVYLGYDGEAPDMIEAQRATAGIVRTWHGQPIVAMYHGNGGGQTESYDVVAGTDAYPYLASVKYPFAHPTTWHIETTFDETARALQMAGIAVPQPLSLVRVTRRGISPRVLEVELAGGRDVATTVSGTEFAAALHLPSTWFFFSHRPPLGKSAPKTSASLELPGGLDTITRDEVGAPPPFPWPLAASGTVALGLLSLLLGWLGRSGYLDDLRLGWPATLPLHGDDPAG